MDFQAIIKRHFALFIGFLMVMGCSKTEYKEEEIGFLGIANVNHFLAASRVITKMGIPSESYRRLENIPPPEDAMIFLPATAIRNKNVMRSLQNWVYEGGTAVIMLTVRDEADRWGEDELEDTPIQAYLEMEELEISKPDGTAQVNGLYFDPNDQFQESYLTDYKNYLTFRYISDSAANESDFVKVSNYNYGDGHMHILSTGIMFTNEHLKEAQHATLLWDLVNYHTPTEVQFIYGTNGPSFFQLLWKYFSYALIAMALLLIIWIWYSAKRFGPIFQTVDLSQNRIDEHLSATGYFFSKHKADGIIIYEVQNKLRAALARRVNLPVNANYGDVLAACQAQGVLTPSEISTLRHPLPENEKDRVAYLQQLQKIKP